MSAWLFIGGVVVGILIAVVLVLWLLNEACKHIFPW